MEGVPSVIDNEYVRMAQTVNSGVNIKEVFDKDSNTLTINEKENNSATFG